MPFVDFAAIKAAIPIADVIQHFGLTLKPEGSAVPSACSACQQGGDRAIVITPAKGLFYCFAAKSGGDCIKLAAHLLGLDEKKQQQEAALYLADQFGTVQEPDREQVTMLARSAPTLPNRPGVAPSPPASTAPPARAAHPRGEQAVAFDPDAYAAKLTFTDEVAALGLSEEDAARLQIGFASTGFHRGAVAIPLRDEHGQILGFMGWNGQALKFPTRLLPTKVVPMRKQSA